MVSVDFGKVYSHVLRDVLWKTLEKKCVHGFVKTNVIIREVEL